MRQHARGLSAVENAIPFTFSGMNTAPASAAASAAFCTVGLATNGAGRAPDCRKTAIPTVGLPSRLVNAS